MRAPRPARGAPSRGLPLDQNSGTMPFGTKWSLASSMPRAVRASSRSRGHARDRRGVAIETQLETLEHAQRQRIACAWRRRRRIDSGQRSRSSNTHGGRRSLAASHVRDRAEELRRRPDGHVEPPQPPGPPRRRSRERQVVDRCAGRRRGWRRDRSTRGARGCRRSTRADTSRRRYPGNGWPAGWLGMPVTTWTSWPAATHSRQCSCVRVGRRVDLRREVVRQEEDPHRRSRRAHGRLSVAIRADLTIRPAAGPSHSGSNGLDGIATAASTSSSPETIRRVGADHAVGAVRRR